VFKFVFGALKALFG